MPRSEDRPGPRYAVGYRTYASRRRTYVLPWAWEVAKMTRRVSVTELRANIYAIFDEVLKTGEPVEVRRGDSYGDHHPAADGPARTRGDAVAEIITCTLTSWSRPPSSTKATRASDGLP